MRKKTLSPVNLLLAATSLFLSACQKEVSQNSNNDNKGITAKVNSWLETQKVGLSSSKADNVDLLINNLDFSRLRIET